MVRQGDSLIMKQAHLSSKQAHLSKKIDKSLDQVPHTEVAEPCLFRPSNHYMQFESRESTFNDILEALQDDDISTIALYGMGGIGKTALAKQVAKTAKDLSIFNKVVFISVTTPPNVKNIQDEIVEQFGWRLKEGAHLAVRRRQVSRRLRNGEHVLIILDNVWQRLDLQEIGILNDGSQRGCKVLLTTRSRQVGYLTGCQRSFHLFLLTDEEAWNFFKNHANINDISRPDLIAAAKEVAKHCQGLPFAILAVAKSLSIRDVRQWMHSLECLWSSKWKGLNWEDDSYNFILQIIQVNYNALSSKVAKTIFLICGLFPEDHEILIEDLSQYAVRLGLCNKNEANAAINSLKDSCLLMHSDKSNDYVILHRLYCHTALMIVYKENPTCRDSIYRYMNAVYHEKDFKWNEELYQLLCQLYGVNEHPSSSTSNAADGVPEYSSSSTSNEASCVSEYPSSSTNNATNGVAECPSSSTSIAANGVTECPSSFTSNATSYGGEGCQTQVVRSYSNTTVATIPKPSGELVDFYGLCQVDKLFLPLLNEACTMKPQLIECQRRHSEMLRQSAFDSLGRLLFLLHNVRNRHWLYHKQELEMFWEQVKVMKFDLEWLSPTVEVVLSSTEIARIEALQEKKKSLCEEAAKLREQLRIVEDEAADVTTEISLAESKLNGSAIFHVSQNFSSTPNCILAAKQFWI